MLEQAESPHVSQARHSVAANPFPSPLHSIAKSLPSSLLRDHYQVEVVRRLHHYVELKVISSHFAMLSWF